MNLQYLKEIFFIIGEDKKKLPLMGILFLLLSILDLAGIGLIAPYITLIANSEEFFDTRIYDLYSYLGFSLEVSDIIFSLGLVLVFIFLIKTLAAILINYILLKFCHGQSVALRASLMNSYQGLPYVKYIDKSSSQYIHNINLADKFATGTLLAFLRIVCEGTVVIAIVIFLAFTDLIALVSLSSMLVILALFYDKYFKPKINSYGEAANTSSIKILKSIQESMIGLKEVRILRKEGYFFTSMLESAKLFANVSVKASMVNLIPRFVLEFAMVFFIVFLVLSSFLMSRSLSDLIPLIGMFGVASLKLVPAATSIISGISKMRFYRDAVNLLYQDLVSSDNNTKILLSSDAGLFEPFERISLQNIEFSYPNTNNPAIKNLTVEIIKSDVVGFIGPSGSGKTTLIDLILGLLEPQKGSLYYNGNALDKHSINEWRSSVAYLPQDVFLVDDTLEKNIALGVSEKNINSSKVLEAIKKARLKDLIDNLPKGKETIIGERGIRVSGGQKQRISLARAFYHEREVLVMDESTSALDTETEQEIVEEINHLKGSKTMIVIAHRITTLQHCNAIYKLDDGHLSEKLTYEQIIQKT